MKPGKAQNDEHHYHGQGIPVGTRVQVEIDGVLENGTVVSHGPVKNGLVGSFGVRFDNVAERVVRRSEIKD